MTRIAPLLAILATLYVHPAGAQDHPSLGRYGEARQVGRWVETYNEANLITGRISDNSHDGKGEGRAVVEGKITLMYYVLPENRSALEAQRNYEASLKSRGFDVVFSCSTAGGGCFSEGGRPGLFLGIALDEPINLPRLNGDYVRNYFGQGDARYTYAKLSRPEGTTHVSLAFSDDASRGRLVVARVVEGAKMDTDMIKIVSASQMSGDLQAKGWVNVYGVLFDFDKADIKPESQPQLQEIAELLKRDPSLKLDVVGHTDNQGGADYNRRLSDRRAFAIVAELATRYDVDRSRLTPIGKGMDAPIASNADEAGRALNRRVELSRR